MKIHFTLITIAIFFIIIGYNYDVSIERNTLLTEDFLLKEKYFEKNKILSHNLKVIANQYIFGIFSGGLFSIFVVIINSFSFGILLKISVEGNFLLEYLCYAIPEITAYLITCKCVISAFIQFHKRKFSLKGFRLNKTSVYQILISLLLIITSSIIEKYIITQ